MRGIFLTLVTANSAIVHAGGLCDFVSAGNRAEVERLLSHGADVNEVTYNQFRPLHLAEDPAIVQVLLRYHPDLNVVSVSGTPLQHAASEYARGAKRAKRWRRIADLLLDAGAEYGMLSAIDLNNLVRVRELLKNDPKAALGSPDEEAPLRVAARDGREEMCRMLLQAKADADEVGNGIPILVDAVKYPQILKLLVDHGADIHRRITWLGGRTGIWIIGDDATILHYVAEHGVAESATLLLDNGVDPFATAHDSTDENDKQTALDVAAIVSNAGVAEAIVTHAKFGLAAPQDRQRTLDHALKLAANQISPESDDANRLAEQVVNLLVKAGGRMDLYSAVAVGDETEVARLLKRDSESANRPGVAGVPSLLFAVMMDNDAVVKLLLDNHCDVNIHGASGVFGNDGCTALHEAAVYGRTALAERLIAAGADINARDCEDCTPLHLAVEYAKADIVRLLVDHGAKVDAKDYGGSIPSDYGGLFPDAGGEIAKILRSGATRPKK